MSPEPFFPLLDRCSEEQFAGGYWSFPEYCAAVRGEVAKLSDAEAAEVVTAWLAARSYPRDRLPPALLRAYARGPRRRSAGEAREFKEQNEQSDNLVLGIGFLLAGKVAVGIGYWAAYGGGVPSGMRGLAGMAVILAGFYLFYLAIARFSRALYPPDPS